MSLPSSNSLVPPLFVLTLLLLSHPRTVAADAHPPFKPIVTPIVKDKSTSLYTIPVKNGASLVLDLAGSLVWSTCQQGHRTIPCNSSMCKVANRNHPAGCAYANGGQPGYPNGGCSGPCTAYPYNPVSGQCGSGDVAVVKLSANATDGERPLFPVSFSAYESCAPDGLQASLPSGAAGVAGLSRLPLSLPSQVASRLKVAKQFALCLPGSGGDRTGAAIFGGGPFKFQGVFSSIDFAELLRKDPLPLLKNPKNGAYYFRVHRIAVNLQQVPIAPGALDLNTRTGSGGVAFSTVTPYTLLRDDIFRALINAFDKFTSGIPRRKPIPPFEMCYEASAFSSTRLGPGVANIDLVLDNGQNWTLPGASSLVHVGENTLCFAFHRMNSDSKAIPESPAIIFGAYQMEHNLVQFDLEKSTFGFSGLLFGWQTTCSSFNFNMGSS